MKAYDQTKYQTVEDGESLRLSPGGYCCRITGVQDAADKEYLRIEFDVADGPFKGYFADVYQRFGYWGGTFFRSYKETARRMFNGFIQAVEKSNPGYKWNWDEKTLIGKLIGVVMGEEEYVSETHQEIRVSLKPQQVKPIAKIQAGEFKIPDIRRVSDAQRAKLAPTEANGYVEVTGDEPIPF